MDKAFAIREITLADLDELVRLRVEFLKDFGNIPSAEAEATMREKTRAYFQQHLPTGLTRAWFMEDHGDVICTGAVVIFHRPPATARVCGDEGYIYSIYTMPAYRRQGLATAMMNTILQALRQAGCTKAWLHASSEGKSVYDKLGFALKDNVMELLLV